MPPLDAVPALRAAGVLVLVVAALAAPGLAAVDATATAETPTPTVAETVTQTPPATRTTTPTPTVARTTTPASSPGPTDLVVDGAADGDDQYATIQAAVDAAADGDTVRVRPGTYRASVTVGKNVTLLAPDGATLDGSTLGANATAITVPHGSGAAPTVAGFTITGYLVGVDGAGTAGDWTVRNTTFRDNQGTGLETGNGVDAARSTGDWTVRDATFEANGYGVDAERAAGDWTVVATIFRDHRNGIYARYATGDWAVRRAAFLENTQGVYAANTSGTWTIRNATFRENLQAGVDASQSSEAWTIYDSTFWRHLRAVDAFATNGAWEIRRSMFAGSGEHAIQATDAFTDGDARRNWWGTAEGARADDCVGNVDCGAPLSTPPGDHARFEGTGLTEIDRDPFVDTLTAEPTATPGGIAAPGVGVVGALGALLGAVLLVRAGGEG